MTASSLPAPAPRRGGAAVRGLLPLLALLAAAPVAAGDPPPAACGNPAFVGLASRAEIDVHGALRVRVTLTDAPRAMLTALPVAFADGVVVAGAVPAREPVNLACGVETAWSAPVADGAAVHWTLLPWPPIPPALAEVAADEAWRRYAERPPPGRFPWADVELVRAAPEDARPAAEDAPLGADPPQAQRDTADTSPDEDHPLLDDGVTWREVADLAGLGYLARARVGARLRFDLRYHPGAAGAGRAWAVCLLDGRQVAPFAGRPAVAATLVAGRAWAVAGEVTIPAPGWHRLTCLLLPDAGAATGGGAPRPLLSAFVWGDP